MTQRQCLKEVAKPSFQGVVILSHDCIIVKHKKSYVYENKPILTGISILEISKLVMSSFWHTCLLPVFHHPPFSEIQLHTSDTDSFVFSTSFDMKLKPDANFWKEYAKLAEHLDTSTYTPETHPFFTNNEDKREYLEKMREINRGKLGKFKDEIPENQVISEVSIETLLACEPSLSYLLTLPLYGGVKANKYDWKGEQT